jgi:hypothetical protein
LFDSAEGKTSGQYARGCVLMFRMPVGALQDLPLGPTGIYSAVCWTAAHREYTMADYISGLMIALPPHVWDTLDDLRIDAASKGCSEAQFDLAVECAGPLPDKVAAFISKMNFAPIFARQR